MNDSSFPSALPAGTALRGGDFVLQNALGQGGFGITYRALDRALNRTAAIKEFFPQGSQRMGQTVMANGHSDAEFAAARERFLGEARTLAQFNHPNIVNVYTIFEENSSAYMVMEFLEGNDLSKIVETHGAMAPNEAIPIIEQIGDALETVHRAGMLHLDVKPDNVIVTGGAQTGSTPGPVRAVLLDFGLTRKLETATGYATTRLDAFARFGTAGYAPLEQYSRNGQTSVTTDVYALAATLYFLVTARAPTEATERASGAPLPDARSFNPRISTPIATALEAGLAMQKVARPQNVAAFLELLRAPDTILQTAPQVGSTPDPARRPQPQRDYEDDFETDDSDDDADETVEEIMEQLFGPINRPLPPQRQAPPRRAPNPFQFPQPMPRGNPFPGNARVPATSCSCAPGCVGIIIFLYFLLSFLSSVLDS